jgi:hypothetical protein
LQAFALDGIQIINNFDRASNNPPTENVGGKLIECVYKAGVNFGDSSIQLITGPPGTETDKTKQRCWTLKTNDTAVIYKITNLDACASTAPAIVVNTSLSQGIGANFGYTGSVSKGSAEVQPGFGSNCSKTLSVKEKYTAVGSGDFWLQPDFWAQVYTPSSPDFLTNPPKIEVNCFSAAATERDFDETGKDPYSIIQTTTVIKGVTKCVTFEPHYAKGGIFVLTANGACGPFPTASIANDAQSVVFVASFPKYVPPADKKAAAAADPAAASVYKGPAEVKSVPVVSFTNTISGLGAASILTISDPCVIVPLRIAQGAAIGLSVDNVLISQVTLNGKTVSIPATSLANTYKIKPSDCSSGRRMLRELREGIDYIVVSESSSPQARMLQPQGTATISTTAVVPSGTTSTSLKNSISTAPAPSLSGTGLTGQASAASTPTETVAVLSVPITWERKVVYKVDPVIKFFNDVPRKCLASCEGEATNKFNIPPSITYIQGALGVAAGMFALAVINLIIYIPSYMCGLCACTSCRCRKPRPAGSFKKVLSVRTFFVLFGIIEIGMLVAAISYIPRFPLGFQQIIDGVFMFVDTLKLSGKYLGDTSCAGTTTPYQSYALSNTTFTKVSTGAGTCDASITCCPIPIYNAKLPTEVTYSLGHAASIVSETAQKLVDACAVTAPNNDVQCPDAIIQGLKGVIDGMKSAIDQSVDMGKTIDGATKTFKELTGTLPLEDIKTQLSQAGMAVIATLIFWVFCFSIFVFQNTFNCCMFGLCSTAMIPLATILMVLAGVYYAIAILGSDFCVDPYTIIKNFFPKDGGMIGDTLNYYLSCGEQPNTEVKGILLMFNPILDMINTAITMIATMGEQIAKPPPSSGPDPFVRLRADVNKDYAIGMSTYAKQMTSALNGIKGTVSCQQIDPIIATFLNGFCTNTIATIGGIARIFVACSVFLFFQLGMGIDLCCFHPGYTSRYVTEDPDADTGAGAPKPMIITGVKAPKVAGSNPMHHSHV